MTTDRHFNRRKFGLGQRVVLNSDLKVQHGKKIFYELKAGATGVVAWYEGDYPVIKLCEPLDAVWIESIEPIWETVGADAALCDALTSDIEQSFEQAICADESSGNFDVERWKLARAELLKDWCDRRISYEVEDSSTLVDFIDRHADQIREYLRTVKGH